MTLMGIAKANTMTDKVIASDMALGSSTAIQALGAAAATTTNPDLKRLFGDFLTSGLKSQEALATYLSDKGYANPMATPDEQLRMALQDADSLISMKL